MFQLICIIILILKKLKIELNSFNDRVSMKNTVKILENEYYEMIKDKE